MDLTPWALAITIGQAVEVAKRKETSFDIFNAGLDDAFLFGVGQRAGGDKEPIGFGASVYIAGWD